MDPLYYLLGAHEYCKEKTKLYNKSYIIGKYKIKGNGQLAANTMVSFCHAVT